MFNQSRQSGFTLIELIMVIALLAILATFAIPSYQNMIQNSMIKTATDSILTGLQVARGEAVKRNVRVQFDFRGSNTSDWTVCLSPAGGGSCPATDDATTIQSRVSGDGSSSDVTATPSTSGPYVFNSFGVMVSPAITGELTIAVDNSASTNSRDLRVVVGVGGAVRSCDPALDTGGTDPRRC